MRSLSFGAAVVAFLLAAQLPAAGADAGLQYRVLPPGEVSCASWTRGREVAGKGNSVFLTQDGVSRAEREGWVHGYFSALNIELLPADRGARRDVTEGIDRDALMAMVDEYCAANPLDSLLGATTSIGATLTRDWLAAHPVSGAGAPVARPSIPAVTVPPRAEAPIVGSPPVVQLPPPAPEILPPPRREPPAPPRVATAQTPTPVPSPPPSPPAPETAMPGAALLQIGAYRTREAAAASWAALRTRYPEVTVALHDDLQEIDLGERGLWYRLRIGPFGSADAANVTCNLLKAQGGDCFVVKP